MSNADWDLGQKLIEQGACSLDQVREVLSLQDRMRKMGVQPKPFARVLLEKGVARREQLIAAGVKESELPPPVEAAAAAPKPAPVRAAPSTKPLALVAIGLAILCSLILFARGFFSGTDNTTYHPPEEIPLTEEERAALTKTELDEIAAFASTGDDFDNAAEVVDRYKSFMARYAGKEWEVLANRKLKDYVALIESHAKAELEELLPGEAPLREQERWGELAAHYKKFPAKFLETTDSGAAVKRKLQEAGQKLAEVYGKDKAEVEQLAGAKKYAEALARVKSLEVSAPENRQEEVAALRARIVRESRGAAEKVRQEVADAYFRIDDAFKSAMLRRDGASAAAVIREFISAPWKEEQRPFVVVRGVDYPALLKSFEPWNPEKIVSICEAAIPEVDSPDRLGIGEGALLALRNAAMMFMVIRDKTAQFQASLSKKELLDLPGLGKGHFERKGGKAIYIAEDGTEWDGDSNPLTEVDLVALAMMVDPDSASMHARAGFFYFYSAPNRLNEAYQHLAIAVTKGARGVKMFLGGLAAAAESDLKRELETRFGAAQDLYKLRKFPQVKKMLGELLQHAEHPYVVSVRPEIEKMLFEIAEGGNETERRMSAQYKAKVESVEGGLVRVTYDFEGKEQLDAFEFVADEGARKFKGRWHLERGAMESGVDASVMRWKPSVHGDVVVEYELTPVDEAQNIVLDLYYHKGSSNHYAVVTGFDWVGKQDGDRENSAEERFGMPRGCVIKYPVTVDKADWATAAAWEGWKSRLVGKPAGPWKIEKGRTAKMRVERTGASIRVLADRVLLWSGEDKDYEEGQLLFYSDRRCRIDNLVITFKPQS